MAPMLLHGECNLFIFYTSLFCVFCSDLVPITDALGLYFQIRDDYANLWSTEVSNLPHVDTPISNS